MKITEKQSYLTEPDLGKKKLELPPSDCVPLSNSQVAVHIRVCPGSYDYNEYVEVFQGSWHKGCYHCVGRYDSNE